MKIHTYSAASSRRRLAHIIDDRPASARDHRAPWRPARYQPAPGEPDANAVIAAGEEDVTDLCAVSECASHQHEAGRSAETTCSADGPVGGSSTKQALASQPALICRKGLGTHRSTNPAAQIEETPRSRLTDDSCSASRRGEHDAADQRAPVEPCTQPSWIGGAQRQTASAAAGQLRRHLRRSGFFVIGYFPPTPRSPA